MDLLKRLITLVVISIFSIVITCHANPPETGSFKIPQIIVKDKQILGVIKDAVSFAKNNDCDAPEYNIYFSLNDFETHLSLYVELEATANVPWCAWDSFVIIDGYTCFFDAEFNSMFARKITKKQRVFNYSFASIRENKDPIYGWRNWLVFDSKGNFEVFKLPLSKPKMSRSQSEMQKQNIDPYLEKIMRELNRVDDEQPLGPYYPEY